MVGVLAAVAPASRLVTVGQTASVIEPLLHCNFVQPYRPLFREDKENSRPRSAEPAEAASFSLGGHVEVIVATCARSASAN